MTGEPQDPLCQQFSESGTSCSLTHRRRSPKVFKFLSESGDVGSADREGNVYMTVVVAALNTVGVGLRELHGPSYYSSPQLYQESGNIGLIFRSGTCCSESQQTTDAHPSLHSSANDHDQGMWSFHCGPCAQHKTWTLVLCDTASAGMLLFLLNKKV